MNIHQIMEELNLSNSTNHKIAVLKKHKDNALLKKVFKYALDGISYTYGISAQRWLKDPDRYNMVTNNRSAKTMTLENFFQVLETLAAREVTGNAAEHLVENILTLMPSEDAVLGLKILGRDLKVNVSSTNAMKIWKDLIDKPCYMRCGTYNAKTKKDISFPAYIQLKADGTYREAHVDIDGNVSFVSRSGKMYEYPTIASEMSSFEPGYYIGELTVAGAENRAIGNGQINSDDVPHDKLMFELWDYVTETEYANARNKVKNKKTYCERFNDLKTIVQNRIRDKSQVSIIAGTDVYSLEEAAEYCSNLMKQGFEGAILKDLKGVFANTTSKHQLKMKLAMTLDVRVTGFQEGTPGTKREKTFGAMMFETDDGKIKGRCSGFTDELLEYYNNHREETIGKIIEVECNDITQAEGSETWALSHPRFKMERNDKTETDTFERAMDIKQMAFEFAG